MKKINLMIAAVAVAAGAMFTSCGNGENKTEEANVEKVNEADMKPVVIPEGIQEVSDNNVDAPAGVPYILDFSATWCGPCQLFHPTFEAAAKKYAGKLAFYSVDVDDNADLAEAYGVEGIPMVVGVNSNGEKTVSVGLMSEEDLDAFIESVLGTATAPAD